MQLVTCEATAKSCEGAFELGAGSRVVQFVGKPPSNWQLLSALK